MNHSDFGLHFVDLYRQARVLSVPCSKVTRARARTISSDLEELVAAYIASNASNELHIYVDQPVGIGEGRVAYPDLVVLDLQSKTVVSILDVKTDIGWKRDGMKSMLEKLSKIRIDVTQRGSVSLGPDPKSRVPYPISARLSCHLVVGASENSGNDLQTPEAMKLADYHEVHLHILVEGRHPNQFSRQSGSQFPGMIVRSQDLDALVKGASAA